MKNLFLFTLSSMLFSSYTFAHHRDYVIKANLTAHVKGAFNLIEWHKTAGGYPLGTKYKYGKGDSGKYYITLFRHLCDGVTLIIRNNSNHNK